MPVGRKEGAGCRIGARSRSGEGLAPREALALAVVDIVGDVVDAVSLSGSPLVQSLPSLFMSMVSSIAWTCSGGSSSGGGTHRLPAGTSTPLIGRRTRAGRRDAWRWDCSGRGYPAAIGRHATIEAITSRRVFMPRSVAPARSSSPPGVSVRSTWTSSTSSANSDNASMPSALLHALSSCTSSCCRTSNAPIRSARTGEPKDPELRRAADRL
jgi:hypothetical protein